MKIALNIFTNSTASAPDTTILRRTLQSFWDTFEPIPLTIYVDENPNKEKFQEYYKNLSQLFPEITIVKTHSLSEGYIHAVKSCSAEFCFMLEHDWIFNKDLIKHSLEEICKVMSSHGLYHMRFNKRENEPAVWDTELKEIIALGICETPCLSNNPHIIDVKKYREICLPLLKLESGSKGIEENLSHKVLTGAIYGGLNYPATIHHIDGRNHK